mgnify:FL=1
MMVSTTLTTALGLGQALLLGAAVVVGTWVASTMIRRRRPLSPVKAIGWLEAAAFVLAPVLTLAAAPFTNDEPSLDLATEKLLYVIGVGVIQIVVHWSR